jgi:hypothetical protein
MHEITLHGHRSEKTLWLEDFFKHKNSDAPIDYNFFEGMHCGTICGNGEMLYLQDGTSPDEIIRVLPMIFGRDFSVDEMRMCQSALSDSAKALNSLATDKDFHFTPYWYKVVLAEFDIQKFFNKSVHTLKNVRDIIKKKYPAMCKIDHAPDLHRNVRKWSSGFMIGLLASGAFTQLQQDVELTKYLQVIRSLEDNCNYKTSMRKPESTARTLKLVDFYIFANRVPFIIALFYSEIYLRRMYQSRASSKR